jgi:hypothetical protein
MDWGSVPQWITAGVAVFAVVVATAGVLLQRDIARKRAAVDMFFRTETDRFLVEAYDAFEHSIRQMKSTSSVEEFCSNPQYDQPYLMIRRYLAIHELIAVAIKSNIFDEGICFAYWGDVIERHFKSALPIIEYIRKQPGHLTGFFEFDRLSRRWIAKRKARLTCSPTCPRS